MNETSQLDRRQALVAGALFTGLALTGSAPAFAQRRQGPTEIPLDELLKPSGLPELTMGPEDAKVTVVEYASMTCGHCMVFQTKIFPEFKKKYIDTGKVRYIFREFPLDARAFAASMLARCAGSPEKSFALIDALFERQEDWAFVKDNPTPKLFEIAKQAGFTQESFDKCLTDQKLLDELTAVHTRASETFGVNATPSFFINGKRLQAAPVMEEFEKVIDPLLSQG
ncbi:DsbA family protein [Hyphomicrobium sp.]|uniref:DsbA family protein n=1 Tax=Hyphomicrobium sp. TaxID=82 RepID=UPI002FDE72CA